MEPARMASSFVPHCDQRQGLSHPGFPSAQHSAWHIIGIQSTYVGKMKSIKSFVFHFTRRITKWANLALAFRFPPSFAPCGGLALTYPHPSCFPGLPLPQSLPQLPSPCWKKPVLHLSSQLPDLLLLYLVASLVAVSAPPHKAHT